MIRCSIVSICFLHRLYFATKFNRPLDKIGTFGSKVPLFLPIHACKFQEFTITETEVLESQSLNSRSGIKICGLLLESFRLNQPSQVIET